MKRLMVYFLIFVMVFAFVGCGAKEKLEEKAGEALTEKILEDATGGDVDLDDGTITYKGEDGEEMVIGGTEWPTSDLAKNIPVFEKGKVMSLMETKDSVTIILETVKKEDFTKYLEKIKEVYTEESYEVNSEGNVTYGAGNGQGIMVFVNYVDGGMNISVTKEQ